MRWRSTVVLGALAVLVLAGLLLLQPHSGTEDQRRVDVLAGWTPDRVETLSIVAPGEVEIVLRRQPSAGSPAWHLVRHQRRWPANDFLVDEMLRSLFAGRHSAVIRPGEKEHTPEPYGLNAPRLTVTLEGAERKTVIRFGREGRIRPDEVWIQVEGDPNIYFSAVETVEAFRRDFHQLRSKQLTWFEPGRARRIVLVERFLGKAEKKDDQGKVIRPQEYIYVTSEMVLRTAPPPGWYLSKPEERLEDAQVSGLLSGLRNLVAADFVPMTDPKEFGLDAPRLRVQVEGESDLRLNLRFGADVKSRKGHLYAWLEGADEVAILDQAKYFDPVPTTRSAFRSRQLILWTEEQTRRIEIEVRGQGTLALLPKKETLPTESMPAGALRWVPEGMEEKSYDRDAATNFGRFLFSLSLAGPSSFIEAQGLDLKTVGLDPPNVVVRFQLEGRERAFLFGTQGKDTAVQDVVMKKSWDDQLYWVPAGYVQVLRRMDLNFRHPKVWEVPRDRIVGFWFEDRIGDRRWQVARDGKDQPWKFVDETSLRLRREVEEDRITRVLDRSNYLQAKQFLGRDEETRKRFHLERDPAYRFWILTGRAETDRKILWITENIGDNPRAAIYYARFEDDSIVFRLDEELVGLLLGGVHQRPKPERDPHDGHHD